MEVIIYRGNQIHKYSETNFMAFVMDRYGDIESEEVNSLEAAKAVIDRHMKGRKKND